MPSDAPQGGTENLGQSKRSMPQTWERKEQCAMLMPLLPLCFTRVVRHPILTRRSTGDGSAVTPAEIGMVWKVEFGCEHPFHLLKPRRAYTQTGTRRVSSLRSNESSSNSSLALSLKFQSLCCVTSAHVHVSLFLGLSRSLSHTPFLPPTSSIHLKSTLIPSYSCTTHTYSFLDGRWQVNNRLQH